MRMSSLRAVLLGCALMGMAACGTARAAEIEVGVYADLDGTAHTLKVAPNEPFWLYLVIEHPVAELPAALGHPLLFLTYYLRLQCRLEIPANLWIINFDPSLGGLCGWFGQNSDPDIDATYSEYGPYLPPGTVCQGRRCLLRIGLMALDEAPAPIRLRPGADGGAADGLPRLDYRFTLQYDDPNAFTGVLGLLPLPGGVDVPVFTVNAGIVPVTATTWGDVKGLYR